MSNRANETEKPHLRQTTEMMTSIACACGRRIPIEDFYRHARGCAAAQATWTVASEPPVRSEPDQS